MEQKFPIFININTQKDFFEGGNCEIPNINRILNNIKELTEFSKRKNIKVVNIASWYLPDSNFFSESPNYETTLPKHCIIGSDGARFIEETFPTTYFLMDWNSNKIEFHKMHSEKNIIVTKKGLNFFEGNPYSESLIHNLGIPIMQRPIFIVYGININSTVLDLLKRGYTVKVVEDANLNFNGMPFSKYDIIEDKQNPYPDQFNDSNIVDDTPLHFLKTKDVFF